MKRFSIIFLFVAISCLAQAPRHPPTREQLIEFYKHFEVVTYRGNPVVPKDGIVKLEYKSLYPGDLNWKDVGCVWWDKTKLGSKIIKHDMGAWEYVEAVPGHTLEYMCQWAAPKDVKK